MGLYTINKFDPLSDNIESCMINILLLGLIGNIVNNLGCCKAGIDLHHRDRIHFRIVNIEWNCTVCILKMYFDILNNHQLINKIQSDNECMLKNLSNSNMLCQYKHHRLKLPTKSTLHYIQDNQQKKCLNCIYRVGSLFLLMSKGNICSMNHDNILMNMLNRLNHHCKLSIHSSYLNTAYMWCWLNNIQLHNSCIKLWGCIYTFNNPLFYSRTKNMQS